jgi:DNA-binding GntR family transcriptional regulator
LPMMSSRSAPRSEKSGNRRSAEKTQPASGPGDAAPPFIPDPSPKSDDPTAPLVRKLKRPADIAQQIFQRLVEAILQGELASGQPLREAALARQWHVSRTPLREAVRRAAENGLLILRPNQAPLVRPFSVEDVRMLYKLREVLEDFALDSAWPALLGEPCLQMLARARRITPQQGRWQERCLEFDICLHHWWTEHCDNPWLQADMTRHYQFLRIFHRWIGRDPASVLQGYYEHLAILEAIENRERRRAHAALKEHIRNSAQLVVAEIQKEKSALVLCH